MTKSEPTSDHLLPGQLQRLRSSLHDGMTEIADYQLEHLIGEGGFGVVYRAEQLEPIRRTVAIKILKLGMDSVAILRRFELERQALASMNHPCIAQVFDAGISEDGRQYFVMEYVAGVSLTAYADERKLNTKQRLDLFSQVCEAVAHAHQKGIIHRDIKPSNVMVTDSDKQPLVKIIDFGIAKAMDADPFPAKQITQGIMLIGTPEYMSPEQTRGGQMLDTRSDVYALGVLLYELLTGQLPFERSELQRTAMEEVYRQIREVDPPRPSTKLSSVASVAAARIADSHNTETQSLIRELRRELEWIPLKAMRKDPDQRYRSATELADDIRNYLTHQPLIAGPESFTYRWRKFLRRYRWPVVAGAAVVASLAAGTIGTSLMAIRAERQRLLAESRFNDVRQLANTFIFDFYESVRNLAGATPAVRQLVDTARTYLEKLEADSNTAADDDLWLEIASSYIKLGDVQGSPGDNNLGDFSGALASFAKAESIFRRWQQQFPDDPRGKTGIASALICTAGVLEYEGQLDEALEMYQRALEIDREAHGSGPTKDTRRRLYSTQFLIASLWQRRGNERRALEEFRAALALVQAAADADSDAKLRTDVAMTLGRIGKLQTNLREYEPAEESLQRALEITRELADAAPDDATRKRNLVIVGDQMALLYLGQNRAEEALSILQDNLEIFRQLSTVDPDNMRASRDVVISLTRIGDVLLALNRHDKALANFDTLVQMTTEIYDQYPTFENGRFQANSVERAARVLISADRLSEALPFQRRVIELREQLIEMYSPNPVIQQELAFAYVILGDVLSQLGQPADALQATEQAISLHKRLLEEAPDRDGSLRRLANSLSQSAKLLIELDRPEEALVRFQAAVQLRRDHLQEDSQDVDRQAGLAVTLASYAEGLEQLVREDNDYRTRAHAAYQESLQLFAAIDDELSDEERTLLEKVRSGLQRCETIAADAS